MAKKFSNAKNIALANQAHTNPKVTWDLLSYDNNGDTEGLRAACEKAHKEGKVAFYKKTGKTAHAYIVKGL